MEKLSQIMDLCVGVVGSLAEGSGVYGLIGCTGLRIDGFGVCALNLSLCRLLVLGLIGLELCCFS